LAISTPEKQTSCLYLWTFPPRRRQFLGLQEKVCLLERSQWPSPGEYLPKTPLAFQESEVAIDFKVCLPKWMERATTSPYQSNFWWLFQTSVGVSWNIDYLEIISSLITLNNVGLIWLHRLLIQLLQLIE